jgi:WD40 repeat protein
MGEGHEPVAVLAEETLSVAFHPDGLRLASGALDGTVTLWDGDRPVTRFSADSGVMALDFSPDGRLLAAARDDGPIDLLRVQESGELERERVLAGHEGGTLCLDFHFAGERLASGGRDSSVRTWDVGTGDAVHEKTYPANNVRSLIFRADHSVVFSMWEHYGVSVVQGTKILTHRGDIHEGGVAQVVEDRRRRLITASGDGSLGFWDGSVRRLGLARGGWGAALAVVAIPTEDRVVAGYADGCVRVWNTAKSSLSSYRKLQCQSSQFVPGSAVLATAFRTLDYDRVPPRPVDLQKPEGWKRLPIWGVAPSPDGRWLATAAHDGRIALWSLAMRKWVRDLQKEGILSWCVAFSLDSRLVAGGTGKSVGVWEAATGKKVAFFETAEDLTTSVAFHPHLPLLASTHRDGTLHLWDLGRARALGVLWQAPKALRDLRFRPDGRLLAAACLDRTVPVWRIDGIPAPETDPDELRTEHSDQVWAIAFDDEGKYLASGSRQGVVVLRDAESLEVLTRMTGDFRMIRSLSFSKASRFLSVGVYGLDSYSVVWDLRGLRKLLRSMDIDWD